MSKKKKVDPYQRGLDDFKAMLVDGQPRNCPYAQGSKGAKQWKEAMDASSYYQALKDGCFEDDGGYV